MSTPDCPTDGALSINVKRRIVRPKSIRRAVEDDELSGSATPGAGPSTPRSPRPRSCSRSRSASPSTSTDNKRARHEVPEHAGPGPETESPTTTTTQTPARKPRRTKPPRPKRSHLAPPRSAHPPLLPCRSVYSYTRLNHIEEGTYGVVFRAKCNDTGQIFALKKLKLDEEKNGFPITSLREVMALMSCGEHTNVVGIREIVVGETLNQ